MSTYTISTRPQTYRTRDGGTIRTYRVGSHIELECRNSLGEVIASPRYPAATALRLLGALGAAQ